MTRSTISYEVGDTPWWQKLLQDAQSLGRDTLQWAGASDADKRIFTAHIVGKADKLPPEKRLALINSAINYLPTVPKEARLLANRMWENVSGAELELLAKVRDGIVANVGLKTLAPYLALQGLARGGGLDNDNPLHLNLTATAVLNLIPISENKASDYFIAKATKELIDLHYNEALSLKHERVGNMIEDLTKKEKIMVVLFALRNNVDLAATRVYFSRKGNDYAKIKSWADDLMRELVTVVAISLPTLMDIS